MTTSEEVATTVVDRTDAGGYESAWLPLTKGYTPEDNDTTEQGGTTQADCYTNHTDKTENTTPMQTTTIPREHQWNTTTDSGTEPYSEFNHNSTTDSSTEYSTEQRNRTLSQYVTRPAVGLEQTTEQTTSSLPSVEGQTTPGRNDSTFLSVTTSASPLLTTRPNDTDNDTDYQNKTIIKQVNTSDGQGNGVNNTDNEPRLYTYSGIVNSTTNSPVNNESYLILSTSSWHLNNTNNSTIDNASAALSEETKKGHVKITASSQSDFEEIQPVNQANMTTTENSVESSSKEVTDQPVITTPLSQNESSTSFQNGSTDYSTEPVLHTVSNLSTSDELDPTSPDEFIENTAAPSYVESTAVTVDDSTAIVAMETVTQEMFTESDSEIRTIEEADHAKTNRSEREVVPPDRPVTSAVDENNTYSTDTPRYEHTTLRLSNSTASQSSPNAAPTLQNDSSTVSTEYVILAENVTPDPASVGNDNHATTDAYGYDDDNRSAESGSQQAMTELPETITTDTSWTEARLDTPSTASVPGVDRGSATLTTPERDSATTRSILLDTLLTASMHDQPETTPLTSGTTDFERRTTERTTPLQSTTIHDLQFVTQPKNHTVQLGHTVVLECVTNPESDITWYVQPMIFCKKLFTVLQSCNLLFS